MANMRKIAAFYRDLQAFMEADRADYMRKQAAWGDIFVRGGNALGDMANSAQRAHAAATDAIGTGMNNAYQTAKQGVNNVRAGYNAATDAIGTGMNNAYQAGKNAVNSAKSGIGGWASRMANKAKMLGQQAQGKVLKGINNAMAAGQKAMAPVGYAGQKLINGINAAGQKIDQVTDAAGTALGNAMGAQRYNYNQYKRQNGIR